MCFKGSRDGQPSYVVTIVFDRRGEKEKKKNVNYYI